MQSLCPKRVKLVVGPGTLPYEQHQIRERIRREYVELTVHSIGVGRLRSEAVSIALKFLLIAQSTEGAPVVVVYTTGKADQRIAALQLANGIRKFRPNVTTFGLTDSTRRRTGHAA
jgi:hypothetical protein